MKHHMLANYSITHRWLTDIFPSTDVPKLAGESANILVSFFTFSENKRTHWDAMLTHTMEEEI